MSKISAWVLDKAVPRSKHKFDCPECGGKKCFTRFRYKDAMIGEYAPEEYGYCDRRDKCGYEKHPANDKIKPKNEINPMPSFEKKYDIVRSKRVNIPNEYVFMGENTYKQTMIYKYLLFMFPEKKERIEQVMKMYYITRSNFLPGASVFWFIDTIGNCHYGQIKSFDEYGKTVKVDGKHKISTVVYELSKRDPHDKWIDDYMAQEKKIETFFGCHLYQDQLNATIGVVEAPATCLLMAVLYPEIIWMATGARDYISISRMGKAIFADKVVFFPDYDIELGAYNKWAKFCKESSNFECISWWDQIEYEVQEGDDYKDYVHHYKVNTTCEFIPELRVWQNEFGYPAIWDITDSKLFTDDPF